MIDHLVVSTTGPDRHTASSSVCSGWWWVCPRFSSLITSGIGWAPSRSSRLSTSSTAGDSKILN